MAKEKREIENINKEEEKRQKAELRAKRKSEPGEVKGFMRAVPVILVASTLFIVLCFITGETGAFGSFISKFLKGLFSYMAYTVPVFVAIHAAFYYRDVKEHKLVTRAVVSFIALITLSAAAYIISAFSTEVTFDAALFYNNGIENKGGGFIGGFFGFILTKIFGKFGLIIILVLSAALIVLYYLQGSGGISRFFLEKLGRAANFGAKLERRAHEKKQARLEAKLKKQRETDDKKHAEIYNDDFFHADNGLSRLEIPELGIVETKNGLRDSNILRETVIRNKDEENIKIDFGENDTSAAGVYKNTSSDPTFVRVDATEQKNKEFRADDIIYEEAATAEPGNATFENAFEKSNEKNSASENIRDYGIDDSASAVFTADFDPFDIAMNEKRAAKQSSRAAEIKKEPAGYSEFISEMTPEQLEHMRRLEQFEQSRKEALRRKEEAERAEAAMRASVAAENERIARQKAEDAKLRAEEESAKNENLYSENSQNEQANTLYSNNVREASRYRFVKDVAGEERIPYSSGTEINAHTDAAPAYSAPAREDPPSTKTIFEFIMDQDDNSSSSYTDSSSSKVIFEAPEVSADKEENDSEAFEKWQRFDPEEDNTISYEENDGLEVSRTMLEPTLDIADDTSDVAESPIPEKHGLDFSFDEDEEDIDEAAEELNDFSDAEEKIFEHTEIPPEEQNPKINEYRSMFTVLDDESDSQGGNADTLSYEADQSTYAEEETEEIFEEEKSSDEPPFDFEPSKPDSVPKPHQEEKKKAAPPDYSNYRFPPLDLLKKVVVENLDSVQEEMQLASEQLLNTLESFNIRATLRGMERGPRITRYSIVPAKGIRVNQIEKLSDDIALAMAAESIRIEAPIPGKSAVGIEVPNKIPTIVSLRELLETDEFMNNKSKTAVCLGKSVEGTSVFGDIGKMPHLLVAGATGMGKSVCMNTLITSILYKARPDEVKFIMIDPKKVEFSLYKGLPHLLVPVVTDPKQAAGSLLWAVDEMNRRYEVIEKLSIRNIDTYNEMVHANPELGAPMSKIVIFIDELNDLMMQARDPVENLIMLIAQKARAAGIHLVIGTQRPSVNVITGVIKANINSRIACKVSSGIDSRTILEQTGAEKLIGKGDMLFSTTDRPNPIRVQGAFVSESETNAIVDFVKKQAKGELYDEQAMEDMKRAAQKCDKKNGDDDFDDEDDEGGSGYLHDRKFLNAVELAIRNGSVATSFLQRKLHIGYGKAAQYIDIMEDLGIVGEKNGSKARDVLISMSEWNEKLSRLTCDD